MDSAWYPSQNSAPLSQKAEAVYPAQQTLELL